MMRFILLNSAFIALLIVAVCATPLKQTYGATALEDSRSRSLIRRHVTDRVRNTYESCMGEAWIRHAMRYAAGAKDLPQSEEEEEQAFRKFEEACVTRCVKRVGQEPPAHVRWDLETWGETVDYVLRGWKQPPRRVYWDHGGNQNKKKTANKSQRQRQAKGGTGTNDDQPDSGTNKFQSVVLAKWDAFKGNIKGSLTRVSNVLGSVASSQTDVLGSSSSMSMPKLHNSIVKKPLIRRESTHDVWRAYNLCMLNAAIKIGKLYTFERSKAPQSEQEDEEAFRRSDLACLVSIASEFGQELSPDKRWQKSGWDKLLDGYVQAGRVPPRRANWVKSGVNQQQQQQQQQPDRGDDRNGKHLSVTTLPKWDAFMGTVSGGLHRLTSGLKSVSTSNYDAAVGTRPGSMPLLPVAKPIP